ncbi:hypothetical protein ACFT2C_07255 [Promicromonospora sp. NPDC057138]|uniref:hypothetical protein n=1 Tax=Promicromonospora sp. NPDC057138 TaxID=3346031 RepID=UPI0036397BB2
MIPRTIVTAVSVLALALTASAPAHAALTPAPAPLAAQDTNVTADAKPEPVAKGKTITVQGHIKVKRDGQWRPLSDRVMTIYFDPAGTDGVREVGAVRSTSTGGYAKTFTATRSGTWIVKYPGNSLYQSDRAADGVCVYSAGRWQCPVSPTNPDLDCPDIGKTVWVGSRDYHNLDADNDGWGCDIYSY